MRRTAAFLEALSAAAFRAAALGAMASVLVMVGVALWQVVARYALDQPPPWTEELARYSMVWVGLLGASCAFRSNSDPTLFPAMRDVGGAGGAVLSLIRALGVVAFVGPIIWFCVFGRGGDVTRGYLARMAGRDALTMELPMIVFAAAIPLSFTFILVHLLARLAADLGRATHPADRKEPT